MWNTILAINSFFVWPLTLAFMIYCAGRMILFLEWKLFFVSLILFAIASSAEITLGIMSD